MSTKSQTSVSVVVPVYNSAATLPLLVERLQATLSADTTDFEVILVNDGSRDSSWDVITALADRFAFVAGFDLMRNYGQQNALLCGIRMAQHQTIVTMDDDLQHPPEEISRLPTKLAEGNDVVYGVPEYGQHGVWRNMTSRFIKLVLQNTMGVESARHASAFRAFRSSVRTAFADYQDSFVAIDVLLTWGTTRFATVQVRHDPRRNGGSNYTLGSLINHAVNLLTAFSTWPLRFASLIGFTFAFAGIASLIYVLTRYLINGGSVPGFPFLASLIAIFSGAQHFALGILGEYLARMFVRSMGRPYMAVRATTGTEHSGKQVRA